MFDFSETEFSKDRCDCKSILTANFHVVRNIKSKLAQTPRKIYRNRGKQTAVKTNK